MASSPEHQQLASTSTGGGEGVAVPRGNSRVRHVVIRDAEIWQEPAPYVVRERVMVCACVHL